MDERDLAWVCQGNPETGETCDEQRPPTKKHYLELNLHAKGHKIVLVDINNGEILATSWQDAVKKNLLVPEGEKGKKRETKEEESGTEFIITGDYETWFPVRMYLPARLFNLWRLLVVSGLSTHENMSDFMCQYTERGVREVHGVVLSLTPVAAQTTESDRITNVENVLQEILKRLPAPEGKPEGKKGGKKDGD